MADAFDDLGFTPAKTGVVDLSALGFVPAVGQDESTDETSALGAAGRGAAGMIPLGTQALAAASGVLQNEPYTQERQEIEKETQADIANHPIARLAGQAVGVVAPALITGGSSAPESLLGAVGQGAGIGAGFGAGNALDTLATGGSGTKAAGDVLLGAGLGAAGGAAGQALAGLAGKAAPAVENFAAKKALQSANLGPEELANMTPEQILATGKMLLDKQIVKPGASTQEMFDAAKALRENYGQTIGQIGNQAQELGLSTDTKPLLDNLEGKYQAADALQNPDERKAALFYKRGMADILAMASQNPAAEGEVPTQITFDQLQRLKKSYGNSAFENGAVKNPAAADVYSQLSQGQKAIVNTAKDNPNLPGQLKDAMAGYSTMHPVVEGLQDVLGKERAGTLQPRAFGMMGKLTASLPGQSNPVINALTSLGLVGAGHPLWGIGAFTATLNNPRVMANAAQSTAEAIPGIASSLSTAGAQTAGSAAPTSININHPEMAPWKPIFQKNALNAKSDGEIQKSNAVTDFILSQRDPSYAAAKQKMSENPSPTPTATETTKMADGGTVSAPASSDFSQPTPGFGSTLEGLAQQLKHPTHEAPAPQPEALPAYSTTKMHEPFNSDLANKLKAFLEGQKEKGDGGKP